MARSTSKRKCSDKPCAMLLSYARKLQKIERYIQETRFDSSRWLSPAKAAAKLNVGVDAVRDELKRAVANGEDVIYKRFHFTKIGQGKDRPRYRIWEADLAETPAT